MAAIYQIGDLTLDVGRQQVCRGAEPIHLGPLTYRLLVVLIEAAPNLVTHDQLAEAVWRGRAVSQETIGQRVKLLRDAIGDDVHEPRYVELLRGRGYRLMPPVVPAATEKATGRALRGSTREAKLPEAAADRHLWAERYDRRVEDTFQLQDEICDQVVAAIQSRIARESTGAGVTTGTAAAPVARPRWMLVGRWTILCSLLATVALAALLTWTWQKRAEERLAREVALPRLQSLIAQDNYAAAFDLALEIERVTPDDPLLSALKSSLSAAVNLNTAPEGAKVYFRPYRSTEQDWRFFGETPLVDVPVPLGVGLWRIDKEGKDTALLVMRNPGSQLGNEPFNDSREMTKDFDFTIPLADAASSPEGMVFVPELPALLPFGPSGFVSVPAFFLDRFEVTNRAYREFVDAGGYAEAAYWQDLPNEPAGADWVSTVEQFVDLTGRAGPASWEAGTHPDGSADLPVTGISWYEAAAYCRFRGKELPTSYHWFRAAGSILEYWESLASVIVHASNFAGRGLEPVGRLGGIGPYGTYDMAGNAREWCWNLGTVGRCIAGGAFNEPPYMYLGAQEVPPLDRSVGNGVRCMRTQQGGPASDELRTSIAESTVDYATEQPIGDAAYAILAQQLAYRPVPPTPIVEEVRSSNPAWTTEQITLPTGYDDTRFTLQLFLPADRDPPFEVVFYGPHGGDFLVPVPTGEFDPAAMGVPLDFLLKSGRALAVVAFDGAFERVWPVEREQSTEFDESYRIQLRHWRQELGRAIDYLGTRSDIDASGLGWFGISSGAVDMLPLLAVEPRISAAVLYSGGGGIDFGTLPVEERMFNYLPRITQPVLMLNGRWDITFPLASQQRVFELLGTPQDRKSHRLFEAGHGNLPRFKVQQATLEWFDRHLGAAEVGSPAVGQRQPLGRDRGS
jgi:DNA-binding winged helix-turn-helix (wHTH) protein